MSFEGRTLRTFLKTATAGQHDALDLAMSDMALTASGPYAQFLAMQYAARCTVESWLAESEPRDIVPPSQTAALAADLEELGYALPAPVDITMPEGGNPIGLAWVLAGSSMGNRAILSRRRKLGVDGPVRFLSDPAMPRFFKTLLPRISVPVAPVQAEGAVISARAAFCTFEKAMVQTDVWHPA